MQIQMERGTTKNGVDWTCVLDQHGFHFSLCKGDQILVELVPVREMPKSEFDVKVLELEAELLEANVCETELLDAPNETSGSTESSACGETSDIKEQNTGSTSSSTPDTPVLVELVETTDDGQTSSPSKS